MQFNILVTTYETIMRDRWGWEKGPGQHWVRSTFYASCVRVFLEDCLGGCRSASHHAQLCLEQLPCVWPSTHSSPRAAALQEQAEQA